jgi:tetratricopeptide (TPR) repeat protein
MGLAAPHSTQIGAIIDDMNAHEQLVAGSSALAWGEWAAARDCFAAALSVEESADALDGLALAVWWLNDPGAALELRARAFARLRHDGRDTEATAVAIWLARQYRSLYRRGEMAEGWLSRARSLLTSLPEDGSLRGWLILAESEVGLPHPRAADRADQALNIAREQGDRDLEIMALTRRGACTVSGGGIAGGLSDLHEAMTAATSGEGHDVQYVGEALCTLMEVAGLIGDPGMVEPWANFLVSFRSSYAFGPLLPFETHSATDLISAFCTGCCGGVYLVTGRLDAAEEQLVRAVAQMSTTGLRPRCLHPVADLVALRVLQGRLEEAEALVTGFEDDLDCAASAAAVDRALGRPARAVDRLVAALDALAETPVLTLPARAQLVDAALEAGDAALAQDAAQRIADLTAATRTSLHRAHRDHAAGKVALARGDGEATGLLRSAALGFAQSGGPLAACGDSRARQWAARAAAQAAPVRVANDSSSTSHPKAVSGCSACAAISMRSRAAMRATPGLLTPAIRRRAPALSPRPASATARAQANDSCATVIGWFASTRPVASIRVARPLSSPLYAASNASQHPGKDAMLA